MIDLVAPRVIAHFHTLALGTDEPSLAQDLEVLRQGRFWDHAIARVRQLGAAQDAFRPGDSGKDCCPLGVGKRVQDRFWAQVFRGRVKEGTHEKNEIEALEV